MRCLQILRTIGREVSVTQVIGHDQDDVGQWCGVQDTVNDKEKKHNDGFELE